MNTTELKKLEFLRRIAQARNALILKKGEGEEKNAYCNLAEEAPVCAKKFDLPANANCPISTLILFCVTHTDDVFGIMLKTEEAWEYYKLMVRPEVPLNLLKYAMKYAKL